MKAILEYSTSESGPWSPWGTVRTTEGQDYTITGMFTIDRSGESQFVGSRSEIVARALTISPDFLDSSEYYFRLTFPEDPAVIFGLGFRSYLFEFNGQASQNKMFEYVLILDYTTTLGELVVIPPEPKEVEQLSQWRQWGGPGRAYAIHFNPQKNLFDKIEPVSFNSVFRALT